MLIVDTNNSILIIVVSIAIIKQKEFFLNKFARFEIRNQGKSGGIKCYFIIIAINATVISQ